MRTPQAARERALRALLVRWLLLVGTLFIVGWALDRTEAAPPAGQVPINPTYIDTPYTLRTLEVSAGEGTTCRFLLEVARPLFQVQLHDARFTPPTFLTYTVPDPNLGYFEDVLAGTSVTPPAGSHWMVIGSQRSADVGGGCTTADASFRRDWVIDWVRAPGTPTPTPTPTPSPTPPPTAAFTWRQTAPNTIAFDGSTSSAVPPAVITGYSWNFGALPPGTEPQATRVYPAPGLYDVTLTVTDSNGQTDAETKSVRVLGEPVVNSVADTGLADPASQICDTGGTIGSPAEPECTLRAAIQAVNNGGGASIRFNIASGAPVIVLQTALPEVNATVFIDGRTQSGGWVTIDGGGGVADGLVLAASGIEVRGLAIGGVEETAVVARGGGATIAGNRLGTNIAGSAATGAGFGVVVVSGGNTIGGATPADMNVVVGASGGVHVLRGSANRIAGNRIGVDATGSVVLAAGQGIGVLVLGGAEAPANDVTIEGNVIAGYQRNVAVLGSETARTRVVDNRVGATAAGGSAPLENVRFDGSPNPTVSGNTIVGALGADLVLAGRLEATFVPGTTPGTVALQLNNPGGTPSAGPVTGTGGTIAGNRIGLDQGGLPAADSRTGVLIWSDATTTTISGNRIAGHTTEEIEVHGGGGLTIASNVIGLLAGRASRGVTLHGTSFATIGGVGSGNTIGGTGVAVFLDGAPDARVLGNRIGTDETGVVAQGNTTGVVVLDAARVTIQGNQVASSARQGIQVASPGVQILENRIGTTADGNSPLPNGFAGVEVERGSATIAGNVIAFNLDRGVDIAGGASAVVVGNSIFGNAEIGIDNRSNLPAAPFTAVFRPASTGTTTRTWVLVGGLPTSGTGVVELFGNDDCTGRPQGRVALVTLGALDAGKSYRLFTVLGRPELQGYTATYTDTGSGRTSDLSVCSSPDGATDTDGDGVPDPFELVGPFGAAGQTRADQVAIPTEGGAFVGLQTSAGRFTGARAVETPAGALPPGTSLPFGVVTFRLEGLAPGGTAGVTVALPTGASANGYLKYGPQSAGGAAGWYSFAFDAATGTGVGAELPPTDFGDGILRRALVLTFVDGQRGDANLTPDGIIDDPGGVASVPAVNLPPVCAPLTLAVEAGLAATTAPCASTPSRRR